MKRKTVSLAEDMYDLLRMVKEELEAENMMRYSFNSTIFLLCEFYLNRDIEDNSLLAEMKEIKEAVVQLMDRPTYVMGNNAVVVNEAPKVTDEQVAQLREGKDYTSFVTEMQAMFAGGAVLPSAIAEINNKKKLEDLTPPT